MSFLLTGKAIVKGQVAGKAIVSETPLSFFLSINTDTGEIIEEGHALRGMCIADSVLVYPFGKGSSGDCLRLWRASNHGVAPVALINREPDFVHVQGAIITGIPMLCNLDQDPITVIKTGDHILIDNHIVYVNM